MTTTLLIGIGNAFRSDDGVGVKMVRELAAMNIPNTRCKEATGEGATLMDSWRGFDQVILFDAVSADNPPGTIVRINANEQMVPSGLFNYSTHAFSVAEAIEMARVLQQLPKSLQIYGIEGGNFGSGLTLSAQVEAAKQQVIEEVLEQMNFKRNETMNA